MKRSNRLTTPSLYKARFALRGSLIASLALVGCTLVACGKSAASATATPKPTATPPPKATPTLLAAVLGGSVSRIRLSGTGTKLSVHVTNDGVTQVPISTSTRVVTSDGETLTPSSIRVGDSVSVTKNGGLQDLSQQGTSIDGIVQTAFETPQGFMIVEMGNEKDIVVDVGSSTVIRTTSNKPLSVSLIATADPVALTGIYDSKLGEMTETHRMVVTQPVRKPGNG